MIANFRYYYINSRDRLTGTDGDFTIAMDVPQNSGFTHVVVNSAQIQKTYYLVEEGRNTFSLTENGTETVVTVDPGNYNYRSFKILISELLTSKSPNGWIYELDTPGYNDVSTGKYTFRVAGENILSASFAFPVRNDLYERFGFDRESTVSFQPTADPKVFTMSSKNCVKFDLENTIYLTSDICSNGTDNVLQEIYVDTSDFSSIKYQCYDIRLGQKKLHFGANDNVYRFSICDEDGLFLDLNGSNVVFTLMLFKYAS